MMIKRSRPRVAASLMIPFALLQLGAGPHVAAAGPEAVTPSAQSDQIPPVPQEEQPPATIPLEDPQTYMLAPSVAQSNPLPSAAWQPLGPAPIGPPFLAGGGRYGGVNSGRITSLALIPSGLHIGRVVAGSAGGGIWTSDDGGVNWTPRSDQAASLAIGAVADDSSNPDHLIAGTGEGNQCNDCYAGFGVLASTDGGTTWTLQNPVTATSPNGVFYGAHIAQVAIDPSNSAHMFAATDKGLFMTSDSGTSWALPSDPTYTAINGGRGKISLVGLGKLMHGTTSVAPPWGPTALRTAGDLLTAEVTSFGANTIGTPSGWTKVDAADAVQGSLHTGILWRIATGSDAAPTITGGATRISAQLQEWSSDTTWPANPLDVAGTQTQATAVTSSTVAASTKPSSPGELALSVFEWFSATAATYTPTPTEVNLSGRFNLNSDTGSSLKQHHIVYVDTVAAAGACTPQTTTSGSKSGNWADKLAIFKGSSKFSAVVIDPITPTTVYVGGGPGTVAKSVDGGVHWSSVSSGIGVPGASPLIALAVAQASPGTLYASIGSHAAVALYKTNNAGAAWSAVTSAPNYTGAAYAYGGTKPPSGQQGWYDNVLAIDPTNANHVLAGGIALVETTDGGATWANVNGQAFFGPGIDPLHPDFHALAFRQDGKVWVGADGGVFLYNPAGHSVSNANGNLNITQFYHGFNVVGSTLLAGAQDNGSGRTSSSSISAWTGIHPGDGGPSAITPNQPALQFTETNQRLYRTSDAFATTFADITPPQVVGASSISALFTPPMQLVPNCTSSLNPTVFYGGSDLFRTTNPTSTPPAWSKVTAVGALVSALAVSPSNPNVVYVGFENGTIQVSSDGGASFLSLGTAQLGSKFVTGLSVDPTNPQAITASFSIYTNRAFQDFAHVGQYAYTNPATPGSGTWTTINGNLPHAAVSRVVYDNGNLIAATDAGVYGTGVPAAGNTSWQPVGANLPLAQVQDLFVDPATSQLFAVTHGRGAWSLAGTANGAIGGTVTDAKTAAPVANAIATAYNVLTCTVGASANTDSNGNYSINGLQAGTYKILFLDRAANYLDQWYSNKPDQASASPVAVSSSTPTVGINAALVLSGVISGTVTDTSTGAALANAGVTVYNASTQAIAGNSTTDCTGRYVVNLLASGGYKVLFQDHPGNYVNQWYNNKPDQTSADSVAVTSSTITSGINAPLASASARSWSSTAPMPTARWLLATVTGSDGRTYALGGLNAAGTPVATVEAYTPATNSWATVAPMPTPRYSLAAAPGTDGRIYAIGGSNGTSPVSIVEAYTPATNSWTTVASMPTARQALAAAAGCDGRIYAFGGTALGPDLATAEAYTPATNSWTTVAPMPTARQGLAAAPGSDGRVYALGGSGWIPTVEAFDPTTGVWATAAPMPTGRQDLAAVLASDGRIYAIGGDGPTGPDLATVEAYTPATNTWATLPPMPTARQNLGAALGTDGRIYAVGGLNGQSVIAIVEAY